MEEKKFMGIYITIHNKREAYLYRRLKSNRDDAIRCTWHHANLEGLVMAMVYLEMVSIEDYRELWKRLMKFKYNVNRFTSSMALSMPKSR